MACCAANTYPKKHPTIIPMIQLVRTVRID